MDGYVHRRGSATVRGRGNGTTWVGGQQLRAPALQGFRLRFDNGRREIDRIAVNVDTEYATVWLADGGYDDPFTATVDWIDFLDF